MHLSKVEIRNFRSFESLTMELQGGLNVLVGRNNTGKTNLLNAIRHALGPSASRGESLWLERDDFYRATAAASPATSMSVTLTFSGLSEQQRSQFFEIVDFDLADLATSKAIVRFTAEWPAHKKQAAIRRTGGPASDEPPEVPAAILESLPITFLPALRDAEAALAPGYRSRLALLLRDLAERPGSTARDNLLDIFNRANGELEKLDLVKATTESLRTRVGQIAGTDSAPATISAADADFDRILRTLHVRMTASPIGALSANGLGLNNLLYMAVVLEHLKQDSENECPLLLVEEPEAHLHPQLTTLLSDYLSRTTPGAHAPQTIVTTHSPTLAAIVPPERIRVLFTDPQGKRPACNSLAKAGMDEREQRALQRMMDVTRATLYFAKAAILVEGVSESLLFPVLAKSLGYDLAKEHVAVIPICGVAFETFKKLLAPGAFGIPVAIVSDGDPEVRRGTTWEDDVPEPEGAAFRVCDRMQALLSLFAGSTVRVFRSQVTLEYDLAAAGDDNARIMAEAWESCFARSPGTFNLTKVSAAGADRGAKALAAWRGICRASHTGSKGEFAHRLAERLSAAGSGAVAGQLAFAVPSYIESAIKHVVEALKPARPSTDGTP